MTEEESCSPRRTLRTLASSLWFPLFFILGFMVFYLLPFHAPAPHDAPVAVVGTESAQQLDTALEQQLPGGIDVSAVADQQGARDAVMDRDVVASYDPANGEMFYAQANGSALVQYLEQIFTPVAAADGLELQSTDLASTSAGDPMGTGLFYCLLALNIAPYVAVMMLLRAELNTRQKLLSVVGVGIFASLVTYLVARSIDVIPGEPVVMLITFMLSQAVGWTTFGLVPLVKQFIPGVAMGLFVLLSIPSSGGAIPKELVPQFFQVLHYVLPLGQTVDAMRGILYFDGAGSAPAIAGLAGWCVFGVLLVAVTQWWTKRKQAADPETVATGGTYEHEDDTELALDPSMAAPRPTHHRTLVGVVRNTASTPVAGATLTVTDGNGAQLDRVGTASDGTYEIHDLPAQHVTVVVAAPGMRPTADRTSAHPGRTTGHDFVLQPVAEPAPQQR